MSRHARKVHEGNAAGRDHIAVIAPLLLMAFFYNGPRVLLLALAAVLAAKIADRLASRFRGRVYDKTENSSVVMALIIVLLMPASAPYHVVAAAVLVAVLVGKEAFGGFQAYPFNPAAVGFCAAAVSWPQQVTRYPAPLGWLLKPLPQTFGELWRLWNFEGAALVQGPSGILRTGAMPGADDMSLLLGNCAGPLGASFSLILPACAVYLIVKKRITVAAPLSFLCVSALIMFIFPRSPDISFATFPADMLPRLNMVKTELLSGVFVFAAVFLVPEPGTLPKNLTSRMVYGALLGFATVMFRYFGTYEMGVCFAFLIVNAVSGYFDRTVARRSAQRKEAALP